MGCRATSAGDVYADDSLPIAYRERGITPGDYYYAIQGRPGYGPQVKTLSEMVARLAELPLITEPGTVYLYSVAYDVLGLSSERVSGNSFDAYCREQIFDPLKMASSGFRVPASQANRLTTNYEVSLRLTAGNRVCSCDRPRSWLAAGVS